MPGDLMVGWRDGSDMGVAYFEYNESQAQDLAEMTANVGDLYQSAGVFTCPAMVVFEWNEILSDGGGKSFSCKRNV